MDINKRKVIWTNSSEDKFWKEMWDIADMVAFEEIKIVKRNEQILKDLKVTILTVGGKNV